MEQRRRMTARRRTTEWLPFEEVVPSPQGPGSRYFANNRYEVEVRDAPNGLTYLSIKRLKKAAVHDWRELWRVKNEITHPDREAFELYPGAWRLVDTSNQYHLFVLPLGLAMNVGFVGADVTDDPPDTYTAGQPRQRPLPDWMRQYVTPRSDEPRMGFAMARGPGGPESIQLTMDLSSPPSN